KSLQLTDLLTHPSIATLASLLDAQAPAVEDVPPLQQAPEAAYEPFALTDVQRAYWIGRGGDYALGGVGTHGYGEIRVQDLDLARLELAWNQLVQRHPMLRMVVTP